MKTCGYFVQDMNYQRELRKRAHEAEEEAEQQKKQQEETWQQSIDDFESGIGYNADK